MYITESILNPSSGIHSGDTVELNTKIANIGSVDADASHLEIRYPGNMGDVQLATDAILAGSETWVNTTFTAPSTGTYDITLTPDANDVIQESSEVGKDTTVALVVEPRLDLSHQGDVTITETQGSLIGPWTVSGTIAREAGEGTTVVPMVLEFREGATTVRSLQVFDVSISGTGYSTQPWTTTITSTDIAGLQTGQYTLAVVIDQSTNEPAATVDRLGSAKGSTKTSGISGSVNVTRSSSLSVRSWMNEPDVNGSMTATNTGEVAVSGTFIYTWEGQSYESEPIPLNSGQTYTYTATHVTELGQHTAYINVEWKAAGDSYDRPVNKRTSSNRGPTWKR